MWLEYDAGERRLSVLRRCALARLPWRMLRFVMATRTRARDVLMLVDRGSMTVHVSFQFNHTARAAVATAAAVAARCEAGVV